MESVPEIDFNDFLEKLFHNPPKNRHEIVLSLDCDDVKSLFERLLSIFHYGSIYFFGDENDKVNLNSLSLEDFSMINKYFISFGVSLNFKIIMKDDMENFKKYIRGDTNNIVYLGDVSDRYSRDICMYDLLTFKNCESNNLVDYRFRVEVSDDNYVLWFNMLNNNI